MPVSTVINPVLYATVLVTIARRLIEDRELVLKNGGQCRYVSFNFHQPTRLWLRCSGPNMSSDKPCLVRVVSDSRKSNSNLVFSSSSRIVNNSTQPFQDIQKKADDHSSH